MKKRMWIIVCLLMSVGFAAALVFYMRNTYKKDQTRYSESTLSEKTGDITTAQSTSSINTESSKTNAETIYALNSTANTEYSVSSVASTQSGVKKKSTSNSAKKADKGIGKSEGKNNTQTENKSQKDKEKYNEFMPLKASNLVDSKELTDFKKLLKEFKLDNIETVTSLIKDFNKAPIKNTGMVSKWSDVKNIKYDDFALANRWTNNFTRMDSNCRITAFLLLMNKVSVKKTISEYGSYLMFDMDVIENAREYKAVKNNQTKFITLFNEIDVKGKTKSEIAKAYGEKWKQYGISLKGKNVSLISVVVHDNYENIVFVGHTGVLIDLGEKIVFVEKIAFEQPYQVSVFNSRKELKDMFSKRPTYFGDGTEEGPFVYENDKLLFAY